jgi:hypothetical protein
MYSIHSKQNYQWHSLKRRNANSWETPYQILTNYVEGLCTAWKDHWSIWLKNGIVLLLLEVSHVDFQQNLVYFTRTWKCPFMMLTYTTVCYGLVCLKVGIDKEILSRCSVCWIWTKAVTVDTPKKLGFSNRLLCNTLVQLLLD